MLNVGLDLNNRPSPHVLFYSYQGIWEESNAPGVIMLRPFLYDETVGLKDSDFSQEALHIYPNPASDLLYINLPDHSGGVNLQVELYDASGRLAIQQVLQNNQLDVSGLPGGIYFLKLRSSGRVFHSKVLINK